MNYKKALFGNKDNIYISLEGKEPEEPTANIRFSNTFGSWYSIGEPVFPNSIEVNFYDLYDDEYTPKPNLEKILEEKVYPPKGNWKYAEGARIYNIPLKVVYAKPGNNGYTFHILEDEEGNEYIWNTSSRNLRPGVACVTNFTVKQLITYHNSKQTIITRPIFKK